MSVSYLAGYLLCAIIFFILGKYLHRRKVERQAIAGSREIHTQLEKKSLQAQEAGDRILATLGSMAEGVLIVDAQGKMLLLNAALEQALGLKKSLSQNAYFWEILRDSEVNEMIEACLRERVVVRKEHSVLLSEKTFEIQVSPIVGAANFLGAVAVFHDVTRLKELERVRTEFVANVSHELKTPLTSILGYVETLKEGAIDDKQNRINFLTIIEEHAKKLSELVEDLLLLSSIESGANSLRIQSVDFQGLLDRVMGYLDFKIRDKKIRFEIQITPKPLLIKADTALFERVISNLLDNAIKYSPTGGKVTVRASVNADQAEIEFIDEGAGIAQVELPRIFERFYRVDKSRSRESGGAGLGLSIAKHIVESHQGKIEVESTLQKGSKFRVRLQYNP